MTPSNNKSNYYFKNLKFALKSAAVYVVRSIKILFFKKINLYFTMYAWFRKKKKFPHFDINFQNVQIWAHLIVYYEADEAYEGKILKKYLDKSTNQVINGK